MLQLARWHYYLGEYEPSQQLYSSILAKAPKQRLKYADLLNELSSTLIKQKRYK